MEPASCGSRIGKSERKPKGCTPWALSGDLGLLKDWNQRWSTPRTANVLAVLVFVGTLAFLIAYMRVKGGLDAPPALGGDAVDYVQIATHLAAGDGFTRDGLTPAVDRPPLYPWLLSITFRSGVRFDLMRWGQAIVLALVTSLVARMLCRRIGPAPVVFVPLLLIADPRVRTMGAEILTEALACGLVTLLWGTLSKWEKSPNYRYAIVAAGTLTLAILCRTMIVVWIPILACVTWMNWGTFATDKVRYLLVFYGLPLLLFLPWGYRNVAVLGEFYPLGTQGAEQAAASRSDEAFARRGMWYNLDETGFFDQVSKDVSRPLAIRRAELSQAAANAWTKQHPFKMLLLPPLWIFQEYRPHGPGDLFVLAFAALGLVLVWRTPEGRVARGIVLAQTLTIGMTWSVAGRFLYPLLGILHYLAIIGLWGACSALIGDRQSVRAKLLLPDHQPEHES